MDRYETFLRSVIEERERETRQELMRYAVIVVAVALFIAGFFYIDYRLKRAAVIEQWMSQAGTIE